MSQIKKLSVKTVYGNVDLKKLLAAPGETIKVMRVIGNAIGSASGASTFGDWTCLKGQFEATNLETGETFESSQLFVPDVALTPILVALAAPETRGVEFAIEVSANYARDAKPGGSAYEYSFEHLMPPDENDPITRIKKRMLALAAPAEPAAPAELAAPAAPAAPAASKGRR